MVNNKRRVVWGQGSCLPQSLCMRTLQLAHWATSCCSQSLPFWMILTPQNGCDRFHCCNGWWEWLPLLLLGTPLPSLGWRVRLSPGFNLSDLRLWGSHAFAKHPFPPPSLLLVSHGFTQVNIIIVYLHCELSSLLKMQSEWLTLFSGYL